MKNSLSASMFRPHTNSVREVESLAIYLDGMAEAAQNEKLKRCSEWVEKLSKHVCAQGYIGCPSGDSCTSDHK